MVVRRRGLCDYRETWRAMREFTDRRSHLTADEIWLLEHPPVFTLGVAGDPRHVLDPGDIPVVHTDRGGQVTYHGPGQLVLYLLMDLRRRGSTVRELVRVLEQSVIDLLAERGLRGERRAGAPGVYVEGRKLAALGLRVRRGCTYHGLALNVDADLAPFRRIHPCGYPGLEVTRLADLGVSGDLAETGEHLLDCLVPLLSARAESRRRGIPDAPPAEPSTS